TLTFKPIAEQFGTATITVMVQDDGGTTDGGVNFLTRTFRITVNPVNDPPSFTNSKGNQSAFDEDLVTHGPALEQVVDNWASNILAGPADEDDQKLTFH